MALWAGYLRFYRTQLQDSVTDLTFKRLCDNSDGMFGLVAVGDDGGLVGLANALMHPSTWSVAGYCYLEDLFVSPHARGTGAGEQLIEATAAVAHERGVTRLYWHTQQFNGPARSLYDTAGKLTSMIVYERDA